jgi:hypothetical protein
MSGSWLNVAASISMSVESSRPVLGHLTITTMARSVTMASAEHDQCLGLGYGGPLRLRNRFDQMSGNDRQIGSRW